ncbi:MAG: hypothetical protein K6F33_14945 [Bacteroidales bacterium]|nr:hypothetical protein [Bacteroidales bacterium]
MKLLLHPLAMPIYTYALFMEIERQSYVFHYMSAIVAEIILLILFIMSDRIIRIPKQGGSPLVNIQSPIGARIAIAISITITLVTVTLIIQRMSLYTWGSQYILLIYIMPAILNIMSGAATVQISTRLAKTFAAQGNAAPPAFIGALSGFTIMMGYKTGIDTFWAFVISLLMFTLSTMTYTSDSETKSNHHFYWYVAGAAQAAAILYFGK